MWNMTTQAGDDQAGDDGQEFSLCMPSRKVAWTYGFWVRVNSWVCVYLNVPIGILQVGLQMTPTS